MRIAGDEYIKRVFKVLSLVSKADGPMQLDALTASSELPKSTVFRILKSLTNLGHIEQTPGGSYQVTNKILELLPKGQEDWIREQSIARLQQIHSLFNETVNLGYPEGLRLRYLQIIESTRPLRWSPDDRLHDELLQTALGRAIVAHYPANKLREILPELCQRANYQDVETMSRELEAIKQQGWTREQNQSCEGVSCYAIPLFCGGESIAAISISIPNARLESIGENNIIKALKALNNQLVSTAI